MLQAARGGSPPSPMRSWCPGAPGAPARDCGAPAQNFGLRGTGARFRGRRRTPAAARFFLCERSELENFGDFPFVKYIFLLKKSIPLKRNRVCQRRNGKIFACGAFRNMNVMFLSAPVPERNCDFQSEGSERYPLRPAQNYRNGLVPERHRRVKEAQGSGPRASQST